MGITGCILAIAIRHVISGGYKLLDDNVSRVYSKECSMNLTEILRYGKALGAMGTSWGVCHFGWRRSSFYRIAQMNILLIKKA